MQQTTLKILPILVLVGLASLFLAACGAPPVDSVYTAAGDGTKPADLTKTSVFKADDDLNIVVKLNAHNHELAIHAVFTAPSGETYITDDLEAGETVGEIVLGLDWEAQGGTLWAEGEWSVAVFVDEDEKETATFRVETSTTSG
ncbi:MAG: hypothetical protein JXA10_20340 [Anaerolineae bacterium]|nr:hypothetical protein [Anaerolineae bacterium]